MAEITRRSIDSRNLRYGHGSADSKARPLCTWGHAEPARNGIMVQADPYNNTPIRIGNYTLSNANGFPLVANEKVHLPISDPNNVYVIAEPKQTCVQTLTSAVPFTIMDSDPLEPIEPTTTSVDDMQTIIDALLGDGVVTVSGEPGAYILTWAATVDQAPLISSATVVVVQQASDHSTFSWIAV